jgi:exonuclease III
MVVWNANSVKSNKSELANFLSINNLDIAAISEKNSFQNRFSMPGYCVFRTDQNQFGGAVMLVVKSNYVMTSLCLLILLT